MKDKQTVEEPVKSTLRAKAHLSRLEEANGKRLLVDLDKEGRSALENLLESGYAKTQKEVVIKALKAAADKCT